MTNGYTKAELAISSRPRICAHCEKLIAVGERYAQITGVNEDGSWLDPIILHLACQEAYDYGQRGK